MNFFVRPPAICPILWFSMGRVYNEQINWSSRKILPKNMKNVTGFNPIAINLLSVEGASLI